MTVGEFSGKMDKIRFAIAFVGRTGSSYLKGLLHSHRDAFCAGEVFAPAPRNLGPLDSLIGRVKPYVHAGLPVDAYLDRYIHARPVPAVGFKLPLDAMQQIPSLLPTIEACRYRIVRMTRDNLLDWYISFRLATINNAWSSDKGTYRATSFRADPAEAAAAMAAQIESDRAVAEATASLPSIHLTYEELTGGKGLDRCLDFLELPRATLKSPYRKQRSRSQRESIENYDELRVALAGSRFAQHFVD